MRLRSWILVLILAAPLWAQARPERQDPRRPAPSSEASAVPEREGAKPPALDTAAPVNIEAEAPAFSEYQLGAEDLIQVTVLDSPEFSRLLRVSAAGTVKLPLVKQAIPAAGLTAAEIEQKIAQALVEEGLLREPSVAITVREFHSKPVSVSGAVRTPVVFQATRALSLNEAITRAGGLGETAGQEVIVTFPAKEGQAPKVMRVPVKSLNDTSDSQSAIWLRGGEEVRVPPAGRVYVLGGVNHPGAVLINMEEPLTLLRALTLAGGPTQTAAAKAFLLRPGPNGVAAATPGTGAKTEVALDLKKLMRRQQPDLPLETNDVIFIPESGRKRATQTGLSAAISSFIYSAGVLVWR